MPLIDFIPGGCVLKIYGGGQNSVVQCPDVEVAEDQVVDGGPLETFVTNKSTASIDPIKGESLAVEVATSKGVFQFPLLRNADAGSITVDTKNPTAYVSYRMQGATLHLSKEQVVAKVNNFLAK